MDKANISWYAKTGADIKYAATEEIYAGTHTDETPVTASVQLWNNRWGKYDVEDLANFNILMYFRELEDFALLPYCSITVNGKAQNFEYINHRAIIKFDTPPILKGTANNGKSEGNENNYLAFDITFSAPNKNLKEDDLKSLYFEIVKQ
jgi:hypothetical protein